MYRILTTVLLSIIFQCGGGILYGVAAGLDPFFVFAIAVTTNLLMLPLVFKLVDKVLSWKKNLLKRFEKQIARGKTLLDRYGWLGIPIGAILLSPFGIAIISRLVGVKASTLYPSILVGTIVVGLLFITAAFSIF